MNPNTDKLRNINNILNFWFLIEDWTLGHNNATIFLGCRRENEECTAGQILKKSKIKKMFSTFLTDWFQVREKNWAKPPTWLNRWTVTCEVSSIYIFLILNQPSTTSGNRLFRLIFVNTKTEVTKPKKCSIMMQSIGAHCYENYIACMLY